LRQAAGVMHAGCGMILVSTNSGARKSDISSIRMISFYLPPRRNSRVIFRHATMSRHHAGTTAGSQVAANTLFLLRYFH
jgi:hypothetical protein